MRTIITLVLAMVLPVRLAAHHEAIFGPQSAALLSKKRFVSTQYYFSNEGQRPADLIHSHIGIVSASTGLSERWAVSASLPFEIQGGSPDAVQGVHDPVFGLRYYAPVTGPNQNLIAALTVEPPASSLEVRALGVGAGALYSAERGHWSSILYALTRTEFSLEEGRKRGNRLFLGGGLAFEAKRLPFSPQLGMSWERTGRREEEGHAVQGSRTSALMLHPTLVKTFRDEAVQAFLVFSVPAVQWSGSEGWQRYRIATGVVWTF